MDASWQSTCTPRLGAISRLCVSKSSSSQKGSAQLGCFSAFRQSSARGHDDATKAAPTLLTSTGGAKSRSESPPQAALEKATHSVNASDQQLQLLAEISADAVDAPSLAIPPAFTFPPRRVPVSSLWSAQTTSARACSSRSSAFAQELALVDASRPNLRALPPTEDTETRLVELQTPRRFPPRRVDMSRLWSGESTNGSIHVSLQRTQRAAQGMALSPDEDLQSSPLSGPRTPDAEQHCCSASLMYDPTAAFAGILNPVESIQSFAAKVLRTAQDTVAAFLHNLMAPRLQDAVGSSTSSARPSEDIVGQPNKLFNGKNRKTCIWNPDVIRVNPEGFATPGIQVLATMTGRGEVEAFFEWKEVEDYSLHFGRLKIYAFNSNGDLFKHEGFGQIHWEKQPKPADGTEIT